MITEKTIKQIRTNLEDELKQWEIVSAVKALRYDLVFTTLNEVIRNISEKLENELKQKSIEDIAWEYANEYTSERTDYYRFELVQWYADDYNRLQYAEEYINKYGCPEEREHKDIFFDRDDIILNVLSKGQYICIFKFVKIILETLKQESD